METNAAPPTQTDLESSRSREVSPELLRHIIAFSAASDLQSRQSTLIELIQSIQQKDRLNANHAELASLVEYLETNEPPRRGMQLAFTQMLKELRSIVLLGETGIPSDHALPTEFIARLVAKFLPTARKESDATRLLISLYSSKEQVRQFADIPQDLFSRLIGIFSSSDPGLPWNQQQSELREALRLLAIRVSWLGLKPEMRERSRAAGVSDSPFYELLTRTQSLLDPASSDPRANVLLWETGVSRCRQAVVGGESTPGVGGCQRRTGLRLEEDRRLSCPHGSAGRRALSRDNRGRNPRYSASL